MTSKRRTLDLMAGQSPALRLLAGNKPLLDQMTGQSATLRLLADNKPLLDQMTGRNSTLLGIEQNRRLLDLITGRVRFASVVGATKPFVEIAALPKFASMIGTGAISRPSWVGVLDALRDPIGPNLYDEALQRFDDAAELVGEDDAGAWWVDRLPLLVQLALLLALLQLLDRVSEFVGDLTGEDVPPAFRSGTQLLFALAVVLLAFIDAKAKALGEGDEDDDR